MATRKSILRAVVSGGLVVCLAAVAAVSASLVRAATPNGNGPFTISGNTPGFIKHATDQGALDPTTVITVTAWLKLHNTNQLDQLVQGQNQKGNANYHQWISQRQFDATYGPTSQELNSVKNFLTAHKLTVVTTADDNS